MSRKEVAERYLRQIEKKIPADGSVNILTVTDKQYENMTCFIGRKKTDSPEAHQLTLF